MKELEEVFTKNANATGVMEFRQIARGKTPTGKNTYIYRRTYSAGDNKGKVFGFEVIIPNIKAKGTYPLPGGKTITYEDDFEEYPGASIFGIRGWFVTDHDLEKKRLAELQSTPVEDSSNEEEKEEQPDSPVRRTRGEKVALLIPVGEFSCKELAEKNNVDYPIAFLFLKEQESAGAVKRTRQERRSERGKPTQLFEKVWFALTVIE